MTANDYVLDDKEIQKITTSFVEDNVDLNNKIREVYKRNGKRE